MESGIEPVTLTRPKQVVRAPGKPGRQPRWTSGAKTLVGTTATIRSRLWYTVGKGTLNEIFFDDIDQANTHSVRFLVTDGKRFFSDEAEDAVHRVTCDPAGPACTIESRCKRGRYTITKEIVTDPLRDVLMMRVRFRPRKNLPLHLFIFLHPHLGDRGAGNDGWVGQYKGRPALLAHRRAVAMALVSSVPFRQGSCGYVGESDGYTRLSQHKPLGKYNSAVHGNIALTAELDYGAADGGTFILSIGFEQSSAGAAHQAIAGLVQDFDKTRKRFTTQWKEKQASLTKVRDLSGSRIDMYRASTTVLDMHESKRYPGGFIASLSSPWGFARSDEDVEGYHVLWPRDMAQTALSKLASGDAQAACNTLFFLACTQKADGGWSQNLFLDGTPFRDNRQMDAISMPILLADKLGRERVLKDFDALPMVRRAAEFLLRHGPVTQQERWEVMEGYSVYSMAVQVAALLAAADFFSAAGEKREAALLRETADAWNDAIDELTYVTGTRLARAHDVDGYYISIAPPERMQRDGIRGLKNSMPNLPPGQKLQTAENIVSPDVLGLVRFGLRAANDPRILSTLQVVDQTLKHRMKSGVGWRRFTKDGYGEQSDGQPFKEFGIGRCWPLLAGERGHYELAAGNRKGALQMLKTMARQASECGMLPEQVWDARDIPVRDLFNGRPTGSGMPLVWAHSEYIRLLVSLQNGAVWDMPPQTVRRYQKEKRTAGFQIWTPSQPRAFLQAGKNLRIDLNFAATVRWKAGRLSGSTRTQQPCLGLHCAMLNPAEMEGARLLHFRIDSDHGKQKEIAQQEFVVRIQVPQVES